MNSSDLKSNAMFTSDGIDIWEFESFFIGPSCTIKNLRTGETQNFGMNCITSEKFKRIVMPKEAKDVFNAKRLRDMQQSSGIHNPLAGSKTS